MNDGNNRHGENRLMTTVTSFLSAVIGALMAAEEHGMKTVSIEPIARGWAVQTPAIENMLVFRSGADAEKCAKRIARALAENGDAVQINLSLRGGAQITLGVPAGFRRALRFGASLGGDPAARGALASAKQGKPQTQQPAG